MDAKPIYYFSGCCTYPLRMFDTIKLMLDICLMLTGLHHCVPEKKFFLVVLTVSINQAFMLSSLMLPTRDPFDDNKISFLHSIIMVIGKGEVFEMKWYCRTKNRPMYQLYMSYLSWAVT